MRIRALNIFIFMLALPLSAGTEQAVEPNKTPLPSVLELSPPPVISAVPTPEDCKDLPKKERRACEKRQKEADKAARQAAEYAADHQSLPVTDIVGTCVSLRSMEFRRDVDYMPVDWFNRQAVVTISVIGVAKNQCSTEAQITVFANFYNQLGTQVGTQLVNVLVPGNGSNPFRLEADWCQYGGFGGKEVCNQVVNNVRVAARSSIN